MNTLKKRKHHTDEERQKILDEFSNSGLSMQKFITLKGIGESTIMRWRRKAKISAQKIPQSVDASAPNKKPQLAAQITNSSPLFVELTQPSHSQFSEKAIQEHDKKTRLNGQPVGCTICVPNGITIKLESLVIDQLALVVKGLLP